MDDEEEFVVIPLWENGHWKDHNLRHGEAKEVVMSVIKQLDPEKLAWLAEKLTARQLSDLAAVVEAERLGRERAHSHTRRSSDQRMKLLDDQEEFPLNLPIDRKHKPQ